MNSTIVCRGCGEEVIANNFCSHCGAPLEVLSAQKVSVGKQKEDTTFSDSLEDVVMRPAFSWDRTIKRSVVLGLVCSLFFLIISTAFIDSKPVLLFGLSPAAVLFITPWIVFVFPFLFYSVINRNSFHYLITDKAMSEYKHNRQRWCLPFEEIKNVQIIADATYDSEEDIGIMRINHGTHFKEIVDVPKASYYGELIDYRFRRHLNIMHEQKTEE